MKPTILKLIKDINNRVKQLTSKSKPKFVQSNEWVQYNKDRYSIGEYIKASDKRKEIIERDVVKSYEKMPTIKDIYKKRDTFINNFNKALNEAGSKYKITAHNVRFFEEFVRRYEANIENLKFRDSGQLAVAYQNYINIKDKYNNIDDFLENAPGNFFKEFETRSNMLKYFKK